MTFAPVPYGERPADAAGSSALTPMIVKWDPHQDDTVVVETLFAAMVVRGSPRRASERGDVRLGEAFHDARTVLFRRRFAEMDAAQLGHELTPQLRPAGCEQFCSHP